jgi:ketosteroid isomerase-like protein
VVFWTFLSGRTIPAEPFRGSDGIVRWIEGEADAFSRAEVQDIQIHELDTDLMIGVARVSGVGRESEIEVTGHAAWLFEMRAGRIARWRAYVDEAAAEQAAETWSKSIAARSG